MRWLLPLIALLLGLAWIASSPSLVAPIGSPSQASRESAKAGADLMHASGASSAPDTSSEARLSSGRALALASAPRGSAALLIATGEERRIAEVELVVIGLEGELLQRMELGSMVLEPAPTLAWLGAARWLVLPRSTGSPARPLLADLSTGSMQPAPEYELPQGAELSADGHGSVAAVGRRGGAAELVVVGALGMMHFRLPRYREPETAIDSPDALALTGAHLVLLERERAELTWFDQAGHGKGSMPLPAGGTPGQMCPDPGGWIAIEERGPRSRLWRLAPDGPGQPPLRLEPQGALRALEPAGEFGFWCLGQDGALRLTSLEGVTQLVWP